MDHGQFVERTGSRHVQKLHIRILRRIISFGRMIKENRVEFQPFRIFHGQNHDPLREVCGLWISICERKPASEISLYPGGFFLIPADHGDGLPPIRLPFPNRLCCFADHLSFIPAPDNADRCAVAADGICRINREAPVAQDVGGKVGDLHGVSVALLQYPESVGQSFEEQFLQLFPVVESVSEMNILGYIAHDSIGAAAETVGQGAIRRHAEILGFVDDHVARLPDAVDFLDPFVDKSERGQIIEVKGSSDRRNGLPSLCLSGEKVLIDFENGAFPDIPAEVPAVFPLELFFHIRRISHLPSGRLILQPCKKDPVEHIDLALHGDQGIIFQAAPDRAFLHEKNAVVQHDPFHWDHFFFIVPAESLQVVEPVITPLDPHGVFRSFVFRPRGMTDRIEGRIPVLIEQTDKELLHRHLGDSVYVQIRKYAGDIVQEDAAAPNDIEVFRTEVLLIVIEDIGNAVHRHCRLA